ncbi:MAG: DUF4215 domain-containing protein [Deltaproteobacteria bacterium]|nr:DUF4215 domain-containing protein [Deltaproteobacteria bacterium]
MQNKLTRCITNFFFWMGITAAMGGCDLLEIDPVGFLDSDGTGESDEGVTDTGTITENGLCGNGIIDKYPDNVQAKQEQCDDGNTESGDGCDGSCQVESPLCGNGIIDKGEDCDDGNTEDDVGCTANCQSPLYFCGNGEVESQFNETCDDGNTNAGDGCSASCQIETGPMLCGNGILDDNTFEQCDDGNRESGDGCNENCQEESPQCGNGVLDDTGEQCDDGNTESLDGCSSLCQTECGFTCDVPGAPCSPACDHVLVLSCVSAPAIKKCCELGEFEGDELAFCDESTIAAQLCGNGIVEESMGEQCDDGNRTALDGCSGYCREECAFTCEQPGAPCTPECDNLTQSCWAFPARAQCCDGLVIQNITDPDLKTACEAFESDTTNTTWPTLTPLAGIIAIFKGDRFINHPLVNFPSEALSDSDYQPSPDGSEYAVIFEEDGETVRIQNIGEVSLIEESVDFSGTLTTDTRNSDALLYEVNSGLFAGGRVVLWVDGQNYQLEITVYGSGVPIITSERGILKLTGIM